LLTPKKGLLDGSFMAETVQRQNPFRRSSLDVLEAEAVSANSNGTLELLTAAAAPSSVT